MANVPERNEFGGGVGRNDRGIPESANSKSLRLASWFWLDWIWWTLLDEALVSPIKLKRCPFALRSHCYSLCGVGDTLGLLSREETKAFGGFGLD